MAAFMNANRSLRAKNNQPGNGKMKNQNQN